MHATLFKGENINRFAAPLQGIAWGALTSRPFVIESLKHIVADARATDEPPMDGENHL